MIPIYTDNKYVTDMGHTFTMTETDAFNDTDGHYHRLLTLTQTIMVVLPKSLKLTLTSKHIQHY
jgi:hypothetical protein